MRPSGAALAFFLAACAGDVPDREPDPDTDDTGPDDSSDTDTAQTDTDDTAIDGPRFSDPRDTRWLPADDANAHFLPDDGGGRVYDAVFAGDLDGDGLPNIVTKGLIGDTWSVHLFGADLPPAAYPGYAATLEVTSDPSVDTFERPGGRDDLSGDDLPDLVVSMCSPTDGLILIEYGPFTSQSGAFVADASVLAPGGGTSMQ